jgi:hypothetical protein
VLFIAIHEVLCLDCELVKPASYCHCDRIREIKVVWTSGAHQFEAHRTCITDVLLTESDDIKNKLFTEILLLSAYAVNTNCD